MGWSRDERGRFKKGTRPGPGRPKKKVLKPKDVELWSYELLRDAWLTFKIANKYRELDILRCPCGNDDPKKFDYKLHRGKFRARCQKCGYWNDFKEKHFWYFDRLAGLTKEEAAIIAMQREGKAPWSEIDDARRKFPRFSRFFGQ